jgi:DNA mismatch repair protein MutL
MSKIKILDLFTANQIAAGEVVERPASVVKELCENSLDAGASVITISIQNGGIVSIQVIDNGTGMDREDAKTAFARHATSKLSTIQDFDTIKTMGFRGEALASIAAVSKITLKTKQIGSPDGSIIRIEDGKILEHSSFGCPEGTNIQVECLFYNTPARYKFLKKDSTEASYIADIIERFILARPDVSFRLIQNNQEILHSPGNNDLKSAIFSVYGREITQSLITVSFDTGKIVVDGFIGKPEIGRNTRQYQSVFVNQRYIKSKIITAAIDEGYKTLLMKGKFAFCVLNISISPSLVDVNVHPQKTEVKFWNDQEIFVSILHALKEALSTGITIPAIVPEHINDSIPPDNYHYPVQQEILESPKIFSLNEPDKNANHSSESENHPYTPTPHVQHIPFIETAVPDLHDDILISGVPIDLKINELSRARFIGVLFHTYLLMELDDNLILIDQHAAHERILFEKLIVKHKNHKPIAQALLSPEIIESTAHEIAYIKENMDFFAQIGFECEIFGLQSLVLRTVPADMKEIDIRAAFRSVLDTMKQSNRSGEDLISAAFYSIACKAAVKANDSLDIMEVNHLIQELQKIPNPTHCPHGRPVLFKMSKHEIEKDFKRIVS